MKMPIAPQSQSRFGTLDRRHAQRGIALITTLLLLTLMIAVTLAMFISAESDTLITGYYRTFRSSFYAADSGANIARQYMLNQLAANAVSVGATFSSTGTPPLSSSDASTALTNTLSQYGSSASASNLQINAGGGANSWKGKFYVASTLAGTPGTTVTAPSCTPVFTPPTAGNVSPASGPYDCGANYPTCTGCAGFAITDFQYAFPYTITTVGQSQGSEQQVVIDGGNLILNVHVAPGAAPKTSFAAWGMFIDQWNECSGGYLVPGTISGPVFTNGAWTFGTSGNYIFTDKVGSYSSTFGYQFNNTCDSSSSSSDKKGSTTIAPTFQAGYSLGANRIDPPTDSFNQKAAVIDGTGTTVCTGIPGCPNAGTLNANLTDIDGLAYPSGGASSGVFLPYTRTTSGGVTTNTMNTHGGGILVEGDAKVTMAASTDASGNATQVFTIVQGGGTPHTTTVTIDVATNTTTMVSGTESTVVTGVPKNLTGSSPTEGTMLYVDGNITSLSGPSSGAAIQDGYASTITAASNITVTGNILYKTEPVTLTQNQIPGQPADTLIPGNNSGQSLGIFTAGGNLNLAVPTAGQDLEIDASIATISYNGSGAIVNSGNAINTLTIVGGRIQNTIQSINTTTRNVLFDRRYTQGGFAPPWFPSTTVTASTQDAVTSVVPSVSRTLWAMPSF